MLPEASLCIHQRLHEKECDLHVNEISFSYEKTGTKTRCEKETKGNSEMAYFCSKNVPIHKNNALSSSARSELSSAKYKGITEHKTKMKILDSALRLRTLAALTRFCRHRCVDIPQCTERGDGSATASLRISCRSEPKVLLRLKLPQREENVIPCSNS